MVQESSGEIYGFNFLTMEEKNNRSPNSLHSRCSSLITNKLLMTVVTIFLDFFFIRQHVTQWKKEHLPCGVISAA